MKFVLFEVLFAVRKMRDASFVYILMLFTTGKLAIVLAWSELKWKSSINASLQRFAISQLRQISASGQRLSGEREEKNAFQLCKIVEQSFCEHAKLPNWIFSVYLHNSPRSLFLSFNPSRRQAGSSTMRHLLRLLCAFVISSSLHKRKHFFR